MFFVWRGFTLFRSPLLAGQLEGSAILIRGNSVYIVGPDNFEDPFRLIFFSRGFDNLKIRS